MPRLHPHLECGGLRSDEIFSSLLLLLVEKGPLSSTGCLVDECIYLIPRVPFVDSVRITGVAVVVVPVACPDLYAVFVCVADQHLVSTILILERWTPLDQDGW